MKKENVAVRSTVELLPVRGPNVFVAYVPVLDVTTQGEMLEAALRAAREPSILAVRGMLADDDEAPTEPRGAVIASIEVPLLVGHDDT